MRQEEIALADFLGNRFGRVYASADAEPKPVIRAVSLESAA